MASPDAILYILGAVVSFSVGALTNRREGKSDKAKTNIEKQTADGEAYERGAEIYERILGGLREELVALQSTIVSLRTDLANERKHSANLERHIDDLEKNARVMRDLLRQAGVSEKDIPVFPAIEETP